MTERRLDRVLYERYVSGHMAVHTTVDDAQYESWRRHFVRVVLPLLPAARDLPVLDVGCGLGFFLYFLAQERIPHHGIDVGREQVDHCQRLVTPHVEQVADTVTFLGAHPAAFAAVTFFNVFEHLADDELLPMMEAARRALAPGGRLLISVPNAACTTALVTRYGDLTHKRLFTEGSLRQLGAAAKMVCVGLVGNEKRVTRSFSSRRARWLWTLRDRLARWLLAESHLHLMEGSVPRIQAVNVLAVFEDAPTPQEPH